jgi:hypothetical protein
VSVGHRHDTDIYNYIELYFFQIIIGVDVLVSVCNGQGNLGPSHERPNPSRSRVAPSRHHKDHDAYNPPMTHLPSPRGPEYIHYQGNCQVEDRGVWREEMGAPISKDHGTVTEEKNISLIPYIYVCAIPVKGDR